MPAPSLSSTLFGALVLATHTQSLPHDTCRDCPPSVLRYPIRIQESAASPDITKRQERVNLNGANRQHELVMDLYIGSKNQKVTVALDTSATDTWVNPQCPNARAYFRKVCEAYPKFDPKDSHKEEQVGEIEYRDHSSVTFQYYSDSMMFGKLKLEDQIFGVATKSKWVHVGNFGLAPSESSHDGKRFNVVASMAAKGLIKSQSFSIDAGYSAPAKDKAGSITFGGLDQKRFSGTLEKCDLQPIPADHPKHLIKLDDMMLKTVSHKAEENGDSVSKNVVVNLDTGAEFNLFPQKTVEAIWQQYGLEINKQGLYTVPCMLAFSKASLRYKFGNKIIESTFKNLVAQPSTYMNEDRDDYSDERCLIRTQKSEKANEYVLGLPFFESAYTVFDQGKKTVHLAQAAYCGDSQLAVIDSNGVPAVTGC